MKDKEKSIEELDTYYIPQNFQDSGGVFNGLLKARNAIEGCILGGVPGWILFHLPIFDAETVGGLLIKITVVAAICIPLAIFGFVGLDGEPITIYLKNMAIFLKSRRHMVYDGKEDINFEKDKKEKG